MADPKRIAILGTGGNSVDILDTLRDLNDVAGGGRYECVCFLDDNRAHWGERLGGVEIRGPLGLARELDGCWFVNGVGSPANFRKKAEIIGRTGVPLERFATVVHPTASVSRTARLGPGTVVFQNATITSNVSVGAHVIILPSAVISHDDVIGDYTCITGGVCVSGATRVGEACYLGTNCTIIGGIEIGARSLVGMGSVVLKSVPPDSVVVGNPARFLRRTGESS
jgi:sugar O-acyltransferase (sialic acid O-acetyltransferase NeuD family)